MTNTNINEENIPDELTQRAQFLFWNSSKDTPRAPLGHPTAIRSASWTNPDTWYPFSDAVGKALQEESAGIGYVFAVGNDNFEGEYGCLDLDGCLTVDDEGRAKPKDWVPDLSPFIDRQAYIEISPGGDGLHIPALSS